MWFSRRSWQQTRKFNLVYKSTRQIIVYDFGGLIGIRSSNFLNKLAQCKDCKLHSKIISHKSLRVERNRIPQKPIDSQSMNLTYPCPGCWGIFLNLNEATFFFNFFFSLHSDLQILWTLNYLYKQNIQLTWIQKENNKAEF